MPMDSRPLYSRGFKRAAYNRMTKHSYQPPIDCSHGRCISVTSLYRVRVTAALVCRDCRMVVGYVGTAPLGDGRHVAEPLTREVPPRHPTEQRFLPQMRSRYRQFELWMADQIDAFVNACMPPDSLIRWWQATF
jgi:hypothetical protein